MNREMDLRAMIGRRPEQDLWRALQDVVTTETPLDDRTIGRLDSRMQGFLFLQDYVGNRKARIAYARSPHNMPYMRDAAGKPDHLDDEDYKKADPSSYHRLAREMDGLAFDQVSIEDAHCCNDLSLLDLFASKQVIFGSVAVARSRIETVEEIMARLRQALDHIDRDRLVVAPDCGLGMLTRDLAVAKLKVMCAAVAEV